MSKKALLIVNFGGPRCIEEISPFLQELLTDKDVIRTRLPAFIQDFLFKRVARKRALSIAKDYELIGGKSPIFEDTEWISKTLEDKSSFPVLTFHRYLPATHGTFTQQIKSLSVDEIQVFPLFPQFSYATTGSIARWFATHLPSTLTAKMKWIQSYASHPHFIRAFESCIREYLQDIGLVESQVTLLFSAHGLPKSFIEEGDIYVQECEASFKLLSERFPKAKSILAYQSQFGKAEWVGPSTLSVCENISSWVSSKTQVVVVPLSFTSDHIETLFEIEEQYLPVIREKGFLAHRCPALNRRTDWIGAVQKILETEDLQENAGLIRQ